MGKKKRRREEESRRHEAERGRSEDESGRPEDESGRPEEGAQPGEGQEATKGDSDTVDISGTTAPSIGPHTVIERDDPEERLARHEQSETDAMGLDKRREVVGGQYRPSRARQLTTYGIFLAVVAAIAVGFIVLAGELDQPPKAYKDEAPWSRADAPNIKPQPIDFPIYGNPGPDSE
jgi:hypothetical protein